MSQSRSFCRGLACAVWMVLGGFSVSAQAPAQPDVNPAVVSHDRLGEGWWEERHKAVLAEGKAHPETGLLLIGDSITNNYDKSKLPDENFQPTWQTFYAPRKALNLGFSGDTTSNVLWRLEHGEVDGLNPKVAVLLIGTNDTNGTAHSGPETVEQAEGGIDAVVGDLETRLPRTHILIIGILPSGISDAKTAKDLAVNSYLATTYGENPRVTYLDVGSIFFKDGALNASIFYDPHLPQHGKPLHPDTNGQRMMAEAIEPTLARLMEDAPRVPLTAMTDINTALIPVPWLEQDSYDWYARHHAELAEQKVMAGTAQPRVVLIGDSITHFWGGLPHAARVGGATAFRQTFGDEHTVLNMGFGWDRTQNVLWRLRAGELSGLTPQWVVLLIGTNNLAATSHARANSPEEIVAGIAAIVAEVHRITPQSRVVLMAILPRGAKADGHFRAPIAATNKLLKERFSGDPSVVYLDIGRKYLSAEGRLPASLMPDGVHPSEAGYQIWGKALAEVFKSSR